MLARRAGRLPLAVLAVLAALSCARAATLTYVEPEPRALAVLSALGQRVARSHPRVELAEQRLALLPRSRPPEPGAVERLSSPSLARPQAPAPAERLGLPSPQEIEAIKKVAQILVMLGEQVLPSILGELAPAAAHAAGGAALPPEEVPQDPVS